MVAFVAIEPRFLWEDAGKNVYENGRGDDRSSEGHCATISPETQEAEFGKKHQGDHHDADPRGDLLEEPANGTRADLKADPDVEGMLATHAVRGIF